jgi:hypothetical protein
VAEQGIWRKRTNQELGELHKGLDIIASIKKEEIGMDWECSKNESGKDSLENN